jgi:hypothetical protein
VAAMAGADAAAAIASARTENRMACMVMFLIKPR